jgi:hypothetical protein
VTRTRIALVALAGCYLAGVWLDGVGSTLPSQVLPRVANYFLQVAALFPRAATMTVEYRAEGWVCADRKWEEIDTRPFFPLDPDDKENRFQRVGHFYRQDRPTMNALDEFLVERHLTGQGKDGIDPVKALGGIRLVSLRIPLPNPGEAVVRQHREPLGAIPMNERHLWYHTRRSKIASRCGPGNDGTARAAGEEPPASGGAPASSSSSDTDDKSDERPELPGVPRDPDRGEVLDVP